MSAAPAGAATVAPSGPAPNAEVPWGTAPAFSASVIASPETEKVDREATLTISRRRSLAVDGSLRNDGTDDVTVAVPLDGQGVATKTFAASKSESEPWRQPGTWYWQITFHVTVCTITPGFEDLATNPALPPDAFRECELVETSTGISSFVVGPAPLQVDTFRSSADRRMTKRGRFAGPEVSCSEACRVTAVGEAFVGGKRRRALDVRATKRLAGSDESMGDNVVFRIKIGKALRAAVRGDRAIEYRLVYTAATTRRRSAPVVIRTSWKVRRYKRQKPAPSTPSTPTGQEIAEEAVRAKMNEQYELAIDNIDCSPERAKVWLCDFSGLTRQDISDGNTGGHSGTARVTLYSTDNPAVLVLSYRRGGAN